MDWSTYKPSDDDLWFIATQDGVIHVWNRSHNLKNDNNQFVNNKCRYQGGQEAWDRRSAGQVPGQYHATGHTSKRNPSYTFTPTDGDYTWSGAGAPVTTPSQTQPLTRHPPQRHLQSRVSPRGEETHDYRYSEGGAPVTSPST